MDVVVCIGSSCYLKGSKDIIAILERLISMHNLKDKVNLVGSFCMGHCTEGVCVRIGDARFSLSPGTTEAFFNEEVLGRLNEA
nr:(2Fe-2S) ferredoxin domain-containing protein [Maliibacterium massiliense]